MALKIERRLAPSNDANSQGDVQGLGRRIAGWAAGGAAGAVLALTAAVGPASARLEGVNRPELLPQEYTPVIDVAGFLTEGEIKRLSLEVANLEKDTGLKVRVLAQNYPETPGLAVREYWGVDDDTIVFVADPGFGKGGGNILNFNVGANVDIAIPRSFWTKLSGKCGSKFYWQENGEESAIVNAVSAINTCAREPEERGKCSTVQSDFDPDAVAEQKKGIFSLF